jgi:phosphate uptake regulator
MNLHNQFSFDMLSEVLQAITNGDDIEQQVNRLTDVERLYLKTLMDLTPEQQEEWVNAGD